jgi:hypothetical protein
MLPPIAPNERVRIENTLLAIQPWAVFLWGASIWLWPDKGYIYRELLDVMPAETWGMVMTGLGAMMFWCLYTINLIRWKVCLTAAAFLWGFIAFNFFQIGTAPTAVATYSVLAANALLSIFDFKTGGLTAVRVRRREKQ